MPAAKSRRRYVDIEADDDVIISITVRKDGKAFGRLEVEPRLGIRWLRYHKKYNRRDRWQEHFSWPYVQELFRWLKVYGWDEEKLLNFIRIKLG